MDDVKERSRRLLRAARAMWRSGLVVESAGNLSLREDEDHILITPTSIPYPVMRSEQMTRVAIATGERVSGTADPSTELPTHLEVYRSRPDVGGIVHTHAPCVMSLSILHRPLPPAIDEMIVYFGGTIEVAEYAFTGTTQLGVNAVRALGDRSAVLLANHGNLCAGPTIEEALHLANVMESCAKAYVQALAIGDPVALPQEALMRGRQMFEARWRKLVDAERLAAAI